MHYIIVSQPMLNWLSKVHCMNVLLEGSPVSISIVKITRLLMSTVVAYSCVIEVVGGVGWVNDAGNLGRYQAGIMH